MADANKKSTNFLRQFRDLKTREFKQITAAQFMDVWNHYDDDGNGYIEGKELDGFLVELVTSINKEDVGPEVLSPTALEDAKQLVLNAFDENSDGRIDIAELAQILPTEETFLLLFRRDNPLDSSVEFMKVWKEYDKDRSGYIEADELKTFLYDLLKRCKRQGDVTEEQMITYTDTVLKLFDRNGDGKLQFSELAKNKDGKLQLSEMAKLLPVKENFLCRPVFKNANRLTTDDIDRVFSLYDRDNNGNIEDEELCGFLKDLMELVEEDYDEEDLLECKEILLEKCDLNHDGKINKKELAMVLMSYNRISTSDEPDLNEESG
ncbi:Calretinin,Calbindin,Secretagogin,Calbindin-32 [Mytilus coruscus]|uniref:Calretinin,Calbindin,Secretagogin,Calbindin-32 n=1 Tax=Mytilus coruscus TaxID=42192 RepID=A0A6J8CKZ5_MYTCO|nr:Calretinin,Calbindin,Secretagogin,Calbindin-32 [Mytilus coruscus]